MPSDADPFLETPLWLLAVLLFAGLSFAREAGFRLKAWRGPRTAGAATDASFVLTSALSLLALLMGFTFSLALNRYDARRELVVQEANALGTAWLRIQQLDDPARSRLAGMFRAYAETRLAYGDARTRATEEAAYRESLAQQALLQPALHDAIAPIRLTPTAVALTASLGACFDLAGERRETRAANVPPIVLLELVLFAAVCAGLIGYEKGRFRVSTSLLFALQTLALILILELDRPRTGVIQVSQQPMYDFWDGIASGQ